MPVITSKKSLSLPMAYPSAVQAQGSGPHLNRRSLAVVEGSLKSCSTYEALCEPRNRCLRAIPLRESCRS